MTDDLEYVYLSGDSLDVTRVLYPPLLKYLDGDLHLRMNVNALLDFAECASANSLLKLVVADLNLIDGGRKCSLNSQLRIS